MYDNTLVVPVSRNQLITNPSPQDKTFIFSSLIIYPSKKQFFCEAFSVKKRFSARHLFSEKKCCTSIVESPASVRTFYYLYPFRCFDTSMNSLETTCPAEAPIMYDGLLCHCLRMLLESVSTINN